MTEILTMTDAWAEYEQAIIPPEAPSSVRKSVREAFYAGALCFSYAETHLDTGEPADEKRLEALFEELEQFAKEAQEEEKGEQD
ncbi:MAG: hypothetical protein JO110_02200 [Acetobacteraceae bacterium]|nr:hypothetical protein [Acetobacteraceae bacterium]